ncbi:GlcG/HbpS family heme-binding protein [Mesorhizobium sp. 1B3]|uniref:GlcG/HbpS family heme-binding protein n=1 Tax=Mesorhizobium sp. 1B3 TaxID=3243599 RepID=UPI003D960C98
MIKFYQAEAIASKIIDIGHKKQFKPLAVVVLNAEGHCIVLKRDDGATFLRPKIAEAKAWGALGMGCGSRELGRRAEKNPAFFSSVCQLSEGRMIPVAGGVVIRAPDGMVLGAVGVSGDVADNDEWCAVAAIEAAGLVADTGDQVKS